MEKEAYSQALDAILEVAISILEYDLPHSVCEKVQLIISIARYKHDVRSSSEDG